MEEEQTPKLEVPGEETQPSVESHSETAAETEHEEDAEGEDQVGPEEEMKDVEILEFGLSEEEIDELIEKLNHLKQIKTEISFEVDEENEFLIKYLSNEPVETSTDVSDMSMRG